MFQKEALQEIIQELKEYIDTLEKEIARNRRKKRLMSVLSYSSIAGNVVMVIMLTLK